MNYVFVYLFICLFLNAQYPAFDSKDDILYTVDTPGFNSFWTNMHIFASSLQEKRENVYFGTTQKTSKQVN